MAADDPRADPTPTAPTTSASAGPLPTARAPRRRVPAQLARRLSLATLADVGVATALAALVLLVHDVPSCLATPYWLDESWVVISTKLPLSSLPDVTTSTPLGWTLLLRLVFFGGDQRYRLLPLLFSGLTVAAGYGLGRSLRWRRRGVSVVAGLLVALALLLQPAALVRNDVKQYTADAFTTVALFALTARLDRDWSRRRLGQLIAAIVLGMFLSHTVAIVGTAALASLALAALAPGRRRVIPELLTGSLIAAAGMLAVYLGIDRRGVVGSLVDYWAAFFPPTDGGWSGLGRWLASRFAHVQPLLGTGGHGWLLVCLLAAGVGTLAASRLYAAALLLPVLWAVALAFGLASAYPFLDQRTSTFLFAATAAGTGIGAAGICARAGLLVRHRGPSGTGSAQGRDFVSDRVDVLGVAMPALALITAYAWVNAPFVRTAISPRDDVRSQVRFVDAARSPDDLILVGTLAAWNFGYYWHADRPGIAYGGTSSVRFLPTYPADSRILMCAEIGEPEDCVRAALARVRGPSDGGRVWIVRSHMTAQEELRWRAALAGFPTDRIRVGPEPLLVVAAVSPRVPAPPTARTGPSRRS